MRDRLFPFVSRAPPLALLALVAACGGGGGGDGGGTTPRAGGSVAVDGRMQKGRFSAGSSITLSELDAALQPTGKNVFNEQTLDAPGTVAVPAYTGSNLVEIDGTGFYMEELTRTAPAPPAATGCSLRRSARPA